MSQQYPPQLPPGGGGPQHSGAPGYYGPSKPPKKANAGTVIAVIGAVIAALAIIGVAAAGWGARVSYTPTPATSSAPPNASDGKAAPAKTLGKSSSKAPAKKHEAVLKVWGSAPSGANITYGSDTDNLPGGKLPFTKSLPITDDTLYVYVLAQLQGPGDIHCSGTIDGKTKTGHGAGRYNPCRAQLSGGLFWGWS